MSSHNLTAISSLPPGTRVLFANFPADGHFNPLTGLAFHLKQKGCDVRWYTAERFRTKVEQMGILFYPLQKASDFFAHPAGPGAAERARCKTAVGKLNFDLTHAFVLRGAEYYEDIRAIHQEFAFEVVVADICFTGIPFITEKMKIPVAAIGVLPLGNTSRDLAPNGLGMTPATSFFGRLKQSLLRKLAKDFLFARPNKIMHAELARYGIDANNEFLFDLLYTKATVVLQSGSPGFEYHRSDLHPKIKFIGALLPYTKPSARERYWYDERLLQYRKIVLVTQGTVETDVNKLIVPLLQAFKNSDVLVIATTGGAGTEALRRRFPQQNLIIEDFIPFGAVMPYLNAYVTNGGFGGVMLAVQHNLPMVVAGMHEGKNEINARIGYFKLGINLRTETPKPMQLFNAVEEVIANPKYQINVEKLNAELAGYDPALLCEDALAKLLPEKQKLPAVERELLLSAKQAV